MIIAPTNLESAQASPMIMITQNDHAHLAADFLALVRIQGLPNHPMREELLFATREHDNGWAEMDSAPMIHPDGRPHDFESLPVHLRQELWQRGIDRHDPQQNPLVALLILTHALQIHLPLENDAAWTSQLEAWRLQQETLLDVCQTNMATIDSCYQWLSLADHVSLAACTHQSQPLTIGSFHLTPEPNENGLLASVGIDPFPLAGSTSFKIAARRMENRRFRSDSDLAIALATARWERLSIRIKPGPPSSIR